MAKKDKRTLGQEKETASEAISRKFKQSPGIYIGSIVVLILISITFIGGDFLSGGRMGGGDEMIFGYYDKIPIMLVSGNIFAQNYEQIRTRTHESLRAQGREVDESNVTGYIWRQAYEQTLVHIAILNMIKKSNYSVPERIVDRAVAKMPRFQQNGRFSSNLYNEISESHRISLWRQARDNIAKDTFLSKFYGLMIPENEVNFYANMGSPMRSFSMVSFNIEDYPESEFLAYARENAKQFGSIHLSKIMITSSEREANRVLSSIKNGNITFEEAARVNSQDGYADRGGDMGSRYIFELDWDIPGTADRDVIYQLGRGEISNVITVNNGWAFFRVENEFSEPDFNDSILMERVRSQVRSSSWGRMENWAIDRAKEFNTEALSAGFENAARWHNLERRSFGPVPINFASTQYILTTLQSSYISGLTQQEINALANNEDFWRIGFSTPLNTPSEPLVQGSKIFVLFPTEQVEADEDALENIRSMFRGWWLSYQMEQSLQPYFLNNGKTTNDDFYLEAYRRFILQ